MRARARPREVRSFVRSRFFQKKTGDVTFRSPPLTIEQLQTLELDIAPRFSSQKAFVDSWQACKDWYGEKHYTITVEGAREWLQRDLERDKVLNFRFSQAADPLAESHPSQYEIPDLVELHAIERGDLHDFRTNPLLSPEQHAAICPRCQLGIRSRQLADQRARALGKKPFPYFGERLMTFQDNKRQRCAECNAWEDEPATDTCERSFWHVPDIWLALHPNQDLAVMGDLGPFMRGFLRRQRPIHD